MGPLDSSPWHYHSLPLDKIYRDTLIKQDSLITESDTDNTHDVPSTERDMHDFARKCNVCGQNFQFKSHLARHMLKHTGERPFSCHLCSYAGSRSFHLKRHLGTVHRLSDDAFTV